MARKNGRKMDTRKIRRLAGKLKIPRPLSIFLDEARENLQLAKEDKHRAMACGGQARTYELKLRLLDSTATEQEQEDPVPSNGRKTESRGQNNSLAQRAGEVEQV